MEASVISDALGPGFLLLLIVGALGVFLQRGASFFLPRKALEWPAMGTLNRLLPGALILLFFLVSWRTSAAEGRLEWQPWTAELLILLAAAALHLAFRRVLLTIVCVVALHFIVFAYVLG